jgi:hypothetical protein
VEALVGNDHPFRYFLGRSAVHCALQQHYQHGEIVHGHLHWDCGRHDKKTIGVASSASTSVVDETAKGTDKIIQKVSGTKKPKKQLETAPEPDESASSVQGGSRSGFCLAGEWKGVRSCVKVANNKECVSGQLFESETKCVNPSLRV